MRIFVLMLICLFVFPLHAASSKTRWKEIKKGLEYSVIDSNPGKIHAFRINPKNYKFSVITAKDLNKKNAYVKTMVRAKGALLAINGGFFTPEYDSLGLLMRDGKVINRIKKTSWWSVFYLRNNKPYITHATNFKKSSSVSMAVESGPRLLVNGKIPKLKPSMAERSVVCIDGAKRVIVIATDGLYIMPADLAKQIRKSSAEGGFGCRTALNLDGGSSTQLYANIGSFKLDVPGINRVTNAVAIYPKK